MCKSPVICSYSTPFKAGVGRHFDPRSPRGERPSGVLLQHGTGGISIHAPREGSDPTWCQTAPVKISGFLSTLPARGATRRFRPGRRDASNFYPRSPRGERQAYGYQAQAKYKISIHAPREGSDASHDSADQAGSMISIHAPREGSDAASLSALRMRLNFYPRSPRGERLCGLSTTIHTV